MSPDVVNGAFELCGAFFTWSNFVAYCRARELKGVYWPATAFFTAWGFWNLFYYTALDQPLSFAAGIILTGGSLAWLSFVLWDKWMRRVDRSIDEWAEGALLDYRECYPEAAAMWDHCNSFDDHVTKAQGI